MLLKANNNFSDGGSWERRRKTRVQWDNDCRGNLQLANTVSGGYLFYNSSLKIKSRNFYQLNLELLINKKMFFMNSMIPCSWPFPCFFFYFTIGCNYKKNTFSVILYQPRYVKARSLSLDSARHLTSKAKAWHARRTSVTHPRLSADELSVLTLAPDLSKTAMASPAMKDDSRLVEKIDSSVSCTVW